MKKLLAFIIVSLLTLQCFAQSARPSAESIETLLRITKSEALYENSLQGMDSMMKDIIAQSLGNQQLTEAQKQSLDLLPAKILALFKEDFKWQNLKPSFIQIYAESFFQSEIDAMIAFYQTPAGLAVTEKMPVVMQKSMKSTQEMMAKTMPRMLQILEENFKETLKKK